MLQSRGHAMRNFLSRLIGRLSIGRKLALIYFLEAERWIGSGWQGRRNRMRMAITIAMAAQFIRCKAARIAPYE
jgi:hypothetical protein